MNSRKRWNLLIAVIGSLLSVAGAVIVAIEEALGPADEVVEVEHAIDWRFDKRELDQ
jgi:hypothetical protein